MLTLIVMDEEGMREPRTYRVHPKRLLFLLGGAAVVVGLFMVLLVVATPIRGVFPGLATEQMREEARTNAIRLQSVEDSLAAQDAYLSHLRDLVLGRIEPADGASVSSPGDDGSDLPIGFDDPPTTDAAEVRSRPPVRTAPLPEQASLMPVPSTVGAYVSALRFPALPPVSGFLTRGYAAGEGHYAVDFAASEGTVVRSIGDGYVIFADWTHDGGHVIMVQHADGFVSVYKHNQRLTRRPGDRVRDRETIALSGNTGEFTTGPHLHFELWQNGLAQDPRDYLVGL